MRQKPFGVSVIVVLVAATGGFGLDLGPHTKVELGAGAWYFEYKEPNMKDTGEFLGIHGTCTYRGPLGEALPNAMVSAEGRAGWGQVDYDGQLLDPNHTPYTCDGGPDWLLEGRILMGYDLGSPALRLTPFVGAGYRYLNDDFSAVTAAGYERAANYFYSPLGIEALVTLNSVWQIGGSAEYDLFWCGRQKSFWGWVTNDQHDGYGARGSLRLVRQGKKTNLILEPYIIYWDIKDSDVAFGLYEPKNRSTEAGMRVALQF